MQIIYADWHPQHRRWIACSLSEPGLVTDAATFEELQSRLIGMLDEPFELHIGLVPTENKNEQTFVPHEATL
jgi:Domain of unknown function (DUF1902)